MANIEKMFFNGEGQLVVIYNNSLIPEYIEDFKSLILKSFPEAIFKKSKDPNIITVSVPSNFNDFSDEPKLSEEDNIQLDLMLDTIERFEEESETKKSKTFEIIPLEGYDPDDIVKDIKNALKDHRNICLIDTYDNYQRFNNGKLFEIKHLNLNYLSDDYCNVVLYCLQKDLSNLRKDYSGKLKLSEWF